MGAHTRPLPPRRCPECKRPATVAVYNTFNSHLGDYCARCGARFAKHLNDQERADREKP